MKRAVILHGTSGDPSDCWHPWLNRELRERGYQVLHPVLPGNDTPNLQVYNDFLFAQDWDFQDNVLVGHSSGATTILNLLMDPRSPSIKAAVLIGSFLEISQAILDSEWYVPGQFDKLFPETGFDWELIQEKCGTFYFVHGSDDPICPIELAEQAAETVGGKVIVIENGGHLSDSAGITELPQLMSVLDTDGVL